MNKYIVNCVDLLVVLTRIQMDFFITCVERLIWSAARAGIHIFMNACIHCLVLNKYNVKKPAEPVFNYIITRLVDCILSNSSIDWIYRLVISYAICQYQKTVFWGWYLLFIGKYRYLIIAPSNNCTSLSAVRIRFV